ncbi:MAG TPA: radical SAM protein [Methanoregulaceae archaeon]|nr:radical SAM protein [Methanoregulaceae archaeon]HPD76418.1 radical SAM protein [Methanoregulaceae archaeon]
MAGNRKVFSFDLEITARCNNDCPHCYINLPAGDRTAREKELTPAEIGRIADEAVALGAVWVLITGGEPLLRDDFAEIYMLLKRKGLLVTVFTNATLLRKEHIDLFKKYPPRDIEISVYGATQETYEKVTRRPGSFKPFLHGLQLLKDAGIRVRFKAMALRANLHELAAISEFCRARTKDYYRFDPLLHMRFDGDTTRNAEITAQRLTPDEIVTIERADDERFGFLEKNCPVYINEDFCKTGCNHLFHCGAGNGSFSVSFDGRFRLCASLWAPETMYDLRKGTLKEAWETVPVVRDLRSKNPEFLNNCRKCPIINLCLWCPAHSYLETGAMDSRVDYFCQVAYARAAALGYKKPEKPGS